jgi:PII-like signaling protein
MLAKGQAVKVSIYITDGATHKGDPLHLSILTFLFKSGISGATAIKGVAGFGSDHHLHTDASMFLSDHLPIKIEFIETRQRAEELMSTLIELAGTGMIEMQQTTLIKPGGLPTP